RRGARDVRADPAGARGLGAARRAISHLTRMPRRKRSRLKTHLEPTLLNAGLRLLTSTLGRLSWPAAQRAGRAIGAMAWRLSRRDRRRALDHLAFAYPDMPEPRRRRLGRDCFRHHGTTLGECLHLF